MSNAFYDAIEECRDEIDREREHLNASGCTSEVIEARLSYLYDRAFERLSFFTGTTLRRPMTPDDPYKSPTP